MAGSRMSAVSAILGALALHFCGLGVSWLQVPTALASWGWQLSAGPGFTCAGETTIGCTAMQATVGCTTADVSCDVVPDDGYECNSTTTQIMCQQDAPDSPVFSPPSVTGSQGCKTASNQATIFWSPSVSCTEAPASTSETPSSTSVKPSSTSTKPSSTTEKHSTTTEKHSKDSDKHSKDSKKHSKDSDKHSKDSNKQSSKKDSSKKHSSDSEKHSSEKHSLSQRAVHPHDQDTVHFIQVPSADAKGSEL
mmetsp:Transcript_126017/g.402786  ORF Transcript_126017/g.402786 Transcript_126017/m.402786 type:complete len:250 (+) Transcript_126017:168-917(+)